MSETNDTRRSSDNANLVEQAINMVEQIVYDDADYSDLSENSQDIQRLQLPNNNNREHGNISYEVENNTNYCKNCGCSIF